MTSDRDWFKHTHYVVHKFGPYRHGRLRTCVRCGVKRRHRPSGWEWSRPSNPGVWYSNNPLCAAKPSKRSKP